MASQRYLTPIRGAVYLRGLHHHAGKPGHPDQHGRQGPLLDNIFVERLWRSLKYEEVYLKAYDNVQAARNGIATWLDFYNRERPHQALKYATPDEIYLSLTPNRIAA